MIPQVVDAAAVMTAVVVGAGVAVIIRIRIIRIVVGSPTREAAAVDRTR